MKCDFSASKGFILRPPVNSGKLPCCKQAEQFLLTFWKSMRPWAEGQTSAPRLIARCEDHMVTDTADRLDLTTISEQEAVVFKIHEE